MSYKSKLSIFVAAVSMQLKWNQVIRMKDKLWYRKVAFSFFPELFAQDQGRRWMGEMSANPDLKMTRLDFFFRVGPSSPRF